jgi:hypothetical protein
MKVVVHQDVFNNSMSLRNTIRLSANKLAGWLDGKQSDFIKPISYMGDPALFIEVYNPFALALDDNCLDIMAGSLFATKQNMHLVAEIKNIPQSCLNGINLKNLDGWVRFLVRLDAESSLDRLSKVGLYQFKMALNRWRVGVPPIKEGSSAK